MRSLVLLLTFAGMTLHASFGCWAFHAHDGKGEHVAQGVENTHEHSDDSKHAPETPCEGPSTPEEGCNSEPCVYAHGLRVDVSNLFVSVVSTFFEPNTAATVSTLTSPRFERVSFKLGSPLRSHLLLSVLLL
jgi:hypothetical protein